MRSAEHTGSGAFDLPRMERSESPTAVLDQRGVIVWVNPAWTTFGASNGADLARIGVGACYAGGIAGELRPWWRMRVQHCIESGQPYEMDYECSSASAFRLFRLRMLPVPGIGVLVTHQLRIETGHAHPAEPPCLSRYQIEDGFIVMCSNCRRVRRANDNTWDWIPSWVEHAPAPVSHGLCSLCRDFYWGARATPHIGS